MTKRPSKVLGTAAIMASVMVLKSPLPSGATTLLGFCRLGSCRSLRWVAGIHLGKSPGGTWLRPSWISSNVPMP